jgi:hypothetical protein
MAVVRLGERPGPLAATILLITLSIFPKLFALGLQLWQVIGLAFLPASRIMFFEGRL